MLSLIVLILFMGRRIQEEWALNAHARPNMNFTWAKKDVKT